MNVEVKPAAAAYKLLIEKDVDVPMQVPASAYKLDVSVEWFERPTGSQEDIDYALLDPDGNVVLEAVIQGDTVREVLDYVQFQSKTLVEQFRRAVEAAVRDGKISYEESGTLLRFYEDGLNGYTYLEQ